MRRTTPARGLVFIAALLTIVSIGAQASVAEARGWLGVYTQSITSDLREGLDYQGDGVIVNGIVADSPASHAGLRKGDVIVTYNSRTVGSPAELSRMVGESDEGRTVALGISRNGERRTLSVELGNRSADDNDNNNGNFDEDKSDEPDAPEAPEAPEAPTPPRAPKTPHAPRAPHVYTYRYDGSPDEMRENLKGLEKLKGLEHLREVMPKNFDFATPDGDGFQSFMINGGRGRLGVRIESMNDDLGSALGAADGRGVLVLEVMKDTPAEKAGMKAGDIVTSVEGRPVYDADDLVKALRDQNGKVSLSVTRKGVKRTVEAELEDAPRVMRMRSGDGPMGLGRTGDNKSDARIRVNGDANRDDMRQQIEELRQQLRELRQQLEDRRR